MTRTFRLPCLGMILLLAMLGVAFAVPASADDSDHLRVVQLDTSGRPQTSVIVAVPERLRKRPLSAEAFTVLPRSESNRLDVRPVPANTLEVVLAFDPATSPRDLRAAGLAASGLLPTLPAGSRVGVAGAPGASTASTSVTDPAAAALSLNNVGSRAGQPILDQLTGSLSLFSPRGSRRRVLVVFSPGSFRPTPAELASLREQVRSRGITVYSVRLQPGGDGDELTALAKESGGLTFPVAKSSGLPDAYTSVLRDLLSQYRLSFRLPYAAPKNLRVDLATDDGTESLVVPIPSGESSGPGRSRGLAGLVLSPLASWLQLIPVAALVVFAARRERASAGGTGVRLPRLTHSAFPVLLAVVASVFLLRLIAIGS